MGGGGGGGGRRKREMKVKTLILCFLALLLVLSMASRVSSREEGSHPPAPFDHKKSSSGKEDGEGVCKGSDSEEECLMKRSVVAHTDYIYTQDTNGP